MKKKILIKIGGRLLEHKGGLNLFINDIKKLSGKWSPVIVHGGGKALSAWLERLGVKYHFVDGQRHTSKKAAGIAEMVLSGRVNKALVGRLCGKGVDAVGLSLKDGAIVQAKRIKRLGYVGKPSRVRTGLIEILIKGGYLPVISTIGSDAAGVTLNVNADWVCPMLAKALKVERMVYLTDVPGILDTAGKTIKTIKSGQMNALIKSGVIHSGMVPKVKSAVDIIMGGIKEIDILHGIKGVKFDSGTRIIR